MATTTSETNPLFENGDMVTILDGTDIPEYFGNFVSDMKKIVGEVGIISDYLGERKGYKAYRIRKIDGNLYRFIFDERGLEKTNIKESIDTSPEKLKAILGVGVSIK